VWHMHSGEQMRKTAIITGLLWFAVAGTARAQAPLQLLTEPQVRFLVTEWGCANVSRLSEGQSGRWFGTCQKSGQIINVMVDENRTVSQGTASRLTEAAARADLMARGCKNLSMLSRGPDGSWHGRCDKDGRTVDVMVDQQDKVANK
jgi:hypothetical protein